MLFYLGQVKHVRAGGGEYISTHCIIEQWSIGLIIHLRYYCQRTITSTIDALAASTPSQYLLQP